MIRHMAIFGLRAESIEDRERDVHTIREGLEALVPLIEEIRSLEVGIHHELVDSEDHVSLVVEFDGHAELERYLAHPAHLALVARTGDLVARRALVDVTIGE